VAVVPWNSAEEAASRRGCQRRTGISAVTGLIPGGGEPRNRRATGASPEGIPVSMRSAIGAATRSRPILGKVAWLPGLMDGTAVPPKPPVAGIPPADLAHHAWLRHLVQSMFVHAVLATF